MLREGIADESVDVIRLSRNILEIMRKICHVSVAIILTAYLSTTAIVLQSRLKLIPIMAVPLTRQPIAL